MSSSLEDDSRAAIKVGNLITVECPCTLPFVKKSSEVLYLEDLLRYSATKEVWGN